MDYTRQSKSLVTNILNVLLLSVLTFFITTGKGEFSFIFFSLVTVYLLAAASSKYVSYYAILAAPFFSYALLLLLHKDPVFSFTVFLPYIFPTALYEFVIRRGFSRGIVLTVTSFVSAALLTAAFLYSAGGFAGNPIYAAETYFSDSFDALKRLFSRSFVISIAGKETSLLSSDFLNSLIYTVIEFIPAVLYLVFYSISFISSSFLYQPIYDKADDDIYERWIIKSEAPSFISITVLTFLAAVVNNNIVFVSLLTTDVIIWCGIMFDGLSSSFRKIYLPGGISRRPFVRPAVLIIFGLISPATVPVTAAVYAAKDCFNRYIVRKSSESDSKEDEN